MKAVTKIGLGLLAAYLLARLANFAFELVASLVYLALALGLVGAVLWGATHHEEVIRFTSSWIR